MLLVLASEATAAMRAAVFRQLDSRQVSYQPMRVKELAAEATLWCLAGSEPLVERLQGLQTLAAVRELVPLTRPYFLASRDYHPGVISFADLFPQLEGDFPVIAGPCSVETELVTLRIAERLTAMGIRIFRAGAFKPRSNPYSFQGVGQAGLTTLAKVKAEFAMTLVSEVLACESIPAMAEVVDVFQVGTRNMANTALLKALGEQDKPVLLKRGIAATLTEFLQAAEYILAGPGQAQVILCERGIRTFSETSRYTLDVAAIPQLRQMSCLPVMVDPSHAAGQRALVEPLAQAAVAAGAEGLLIEVHDQPQQAYSDGFQALSLEALQALLPRLQAIHELSG